MMVRSLLARCLLTIALLAAGSAAPRAEGARSIAVFDVELVNTSPEPSRPDELARVSRLGDNLRAALAKSGLYRIVDLAPIREKLAGLPALRGCNGCERDLARQLGADLAAIAWVQKVSNLILNINVEIEDVASGRLVKAGSVDIRGNTDESWDRGLRFLLEEHVFGDRP